MSRIKEKPFAAKDAIEEILNHHPNLPDDQLLEEAKRVFDQHKGPKTGRGVSKEDVKEFREEWGYLDAPAGQKRVPAKPARTDKYYPEDAILAVRVKSPKISDADLLKEANKLYRDHEGPKTASEVTEKDLKEYGSNVTWLNAPPLTPPIQDTLSPPEAASLRKKYVVIGQMFKESDLHGRFFSDLPDEELARRCNLDRLRVRPGEPPRSDEIDVKYVKAYRIFLAVQATAPPAIAASTTASQFKKFRVLAEVYNLAKNERPPPSIEEVAKRANVLRLMIPEGSKPKSAAIKEKDVEAYLKSLTAEPVGRRPRSAGLPPAASLEEKNKLINDVYYDVTGYGSIAQTVKQVNAYIKKNGLNIQNITAEDVKAWKQGNLAPKTKPGGYNSFIPDSVELEVQIDLFYMADITDVEDKEKTLEALQEADDAPRLRGKVNALLMVEIFSKYTWVVEIADKGATTMIHALSECFKEMPMHPKYPKYVYSDMEGAFISKDVQKFFADKHVTHLLSLNHAPYAERQIRTIKNMLYKRMEHDAARGFGRMKWQDYLPQVLTTFNEHMVSNVTKLTPAAALKPENHDKVLMNLELTRRTKRLDQPLKVGDEVKIYRKKKTFDKERVPVWSDKTYKITGVVEYEMKAMRTADGGEPAFTKQKFYTVTGQSYPLQRSQILLVRAA